MCSHSCIGCITSCEDYYILEGMIDRDNNTCVYCKFNKITYEYMKKYSDFVGSSIADFIRQSVAERIIKLGELNIKEINNEKI